MSVSFQIPTVISEIRAKANGKRRVRTLTDQAVESLIVRAAEMPIGGYTWTDAGTVPAAYNYPSTTTIAIAVRTAEGVVVGITTSPAHAASCGRAWGELSYFRPGTAATRRRVQAWAANLGANDRVLVRI